MQDIDVRISRARSQLIQQHAFFGALALRLIAVANEAVPKMATDGKYLLYSRKFLDSESEAVALFAVAHEVLHCALGHHVRRRGRELHEWNIACDYVDNWMLHLAGFPIPDWVYFDAKYAGMSAEEVFAIRANEKKEEEKQKQQEQQQKPDKDQEDEQSDDPQSGSGSSGTEDEDDDADQETGDDDSSDNSEDDDYDDEGFREECQSCGQRQQADNEDEEADLRELGKGEPPFDADGEEGTSGGSKAVEGPNYSPPTYDDPKLIGEVLDAAPEHDKPALQEAAEEWQVAVRQAVNIARRAGNMPGFIKEVVEVLNDPKTDWREVLRRFVEPSQTKDYSWVSPNRRFMAMGYYTPGLVSDGVNHVAIVIDTSASIDSVWLAKFGCETQDALDNGAIDKVTLIFADTQVNKTTEYGKGETIDFTCEGRGGTAFSPTFAWLNENAPDLAAAVFFTDLECLDFGPQPSFPVLWAAYGSDPRMTKYWIAQVPWGEVVELK